MMNSHHSSSDSGLRDDGSEAFGLLDERIQRWVWSQGWTELRDIQEQAVQPILDANKDLIIASPTASGKTEAVFLPILSQILSRTPDAGIDVLYIGPLKALINDQFERLDLLCEHLDVRVTRWHGDVSQSQKKTLLNNPEGLLLITPESLESLFVNHGTQLTAMFSMLQFVVVDELHSYIGTERGRQVQSLLDRLEMITGRTIPRIGLSATIGEIHLAKSFLRPRDSLLCILIQSGSARKEIQVQVRGYKLKPLELVVEGEVEEAATGGRIEITGDLFKTLRGTTNLVFANRRRDVEICADMLRRLCEQHNLPNEFWPHHGSLSKELREDVERIVKDKSQPASVVCTSSLELGIDIGTVNSVAQIGPPPSVASLRQRVGRSGRRGQPSVLRIYIPEEEITSATPIQSRLREELVQAIAMFELMIKGWSEPPIDTSLHFSTLIQQTLSLIAQFGGIRAASAWEVLCHLGPFQNVDKKTYADLLQGLGSKEILIQDSEGLLLLGSKGERIVNHYSFYTAFNTAEEYSLITQEGVMIGTLPIEYPLVPGMFLIFGGRRWEVLELVPERKVIVLKPSKGGRAPDWGGSGKWIHDRVRQEMFAVYCSGTIPPYLNPQAADLLSEGRENFRMHGLNSKRVMENSDGVLIFPWRGDRVINTLSVHMKSDGFRVDREGMALFVPDTQLAAVQNYLRTLPLSRLRTAVELAESVPNKVVEKFDALLPEPLLNRGYASAHFAVADTAATLKEILNSL